MRARENNMPVQSEYSRQSVNKRKGEIAAVLLKYKIPISELFPGRHYRNQKADDSKLDVNKRWKLALQDLGPTFIKFGQMMSTRPDIVSPELANELKTLTDDVKTIPWEIIEPIIQEYCGPIDETFEFLNTQPLGSASLSQVYLGKLKDGTEVVLKVQRPGIKEVIEVDLQILKEIGDKVKSSPELQLFDSAATIEDFSRQILSELDFTKDGRNADLLASNMRSINGIRIPRIYWEHSGQRLLVMEYMKGVRIDKLEQIKKMGVDPKKIALLGFQAYWKMVFEDGFFHGDPHPGNLLVTSEGELVVLDFGLFGVIRPEKRDHLLRLLLGLVENKIDMVVRALDSLGMRVEEPMVDAFKDDIYLTLVENKSKTIEPDIKIVGDLVAILRKYRLMVPSSFMLYIKIFGMVQEICSKLYPEFILLQEARPLLETSLERRIQKEADLRQVGIRMLERFESLNEFPDNVNMTLKQLSKGSFISKIPEGDLERLGRIADRTSYRILIGLMVASFVIGMSLVVLATQNAVVAEPTLIIVLVYAVAILIVVFSAAQLIRSIDKH
jgi:ubiquinone biosynthesis protein